MLAVFAEFEWDILRDRVKAGIAQARKDGCREPSWRENVELRAEKAIECENIDPKYSWVRWLPPKGCNSKRSN
jgi:DNA invertase Pin-like site-specific DNA recombinase